MGVTHSAAGSNAFPILQPLISKPYVSFCDNQWETAVGVWASGTGTQLVLAVLENSLRPCFMFFVAID